VYCAAGMQVCAAEACCPIGSVSRRGSRQVADARLRNELTTERVSRGVAFLSTSSRWGAARGVPTPVVLAFNVLVRGARPRGGLLRLHDRGVSNSSSRRGAVADSPADLSDPRRFACCKKASRDFDLDGEIIRPGSFSRTYPVGSNESVRGQSCAPHQQTNRTGLRVVRAGGAATTLAGSLI
jgi:hypothetical protein